ncbi:MAG: NAD-dependent succinate-semialdehyde dehydrogenase [Cyclobacteriaceae bacterium]
MSSQKDNTINTSNPATGKSLNTYEMFSNEKVEEKIKACHEAFLEWRHVSREDRAEKIKAFAEVLDKNREKLSDIMTDEMGKLLKQSDQEVDTCIGVCKYTAENGPDELQNIERPLATEGRGIITFSPIGVIYGIQPWNYPAYQVIRYAIVNLMAGNGVLLKHAENVTGTGLLLEELMLEAGFPENIFTVLLIDHDQSDKVVENELVRGVTLTGSDGAGEAVAEKAGAALKKTVMELGSNDAYIVLADADIDKAVEVSVKGRIYNNGETCIAAKRFVVVEDIYDEFKEKFVKSMSELKIGDPRSEDTDIGPMAREDLREKLHDQLKESVDNGAKVLCGGAVPDGDGYFYPATVLGEVKPGQPAYDDELFGPVASLIRAKDEDDAMRIANDSRYGLGGGIFSRDEDKAISLAEKHFDTGMVFINSFGLADPAMPFGGVKDSGYGREHGGFGMKEFVNIKAIQIRD